MLHLLVATTNRGKIKEIADILKDKYIRLKGLADFPEFNFIHIEESGETFTDNALIKARTFGRLTGLITLADDSGLVVEALDGRPGVKSARYGKSDEDRIGKLLAEMKDIPETRRQAHFVCSIVIYDPSSDKFHAVEGRVDGIIAAKLDGNNGFGYDPIFFCPEIGKTFGQATSLEKNQVSHRAKALAQLHELIRKHFT